VAISSLHSSKHQRRFIFFLHSSGCSLSPPLQSQPLEHIPFAKKKGKLEQIYITIVFALLFYQISDAHTRFLPGKILTKQLAGTDAHTRFLPGKILTKQ
jgi:hypothetical protein